MSEEKKKNSINPALRNFFFFALKGKKEFKQAQEAIGKIETVTIIITEAKTIMKAESKNDFRDTVFTPEEKAQLLKTFKVKQETVDACKSIFVMLDMSNKKIYIQQNKKDGTLKDVTI